MENKVLSYEDIVRVLDATSNKNKKIFTYKRNTRPFNNDMHNFKGGDATSSS